MSRCPLRWGMQYVKRAMLLVSLALATGCGSDDDEKAAEDPAPANFTEQVALGTEVFGAHCAKCHGDAGEGTADAPPLVGAEALPLDPPSGAKVRKSQFVTVADVAEFAVEYMPGDAPGTLSEEEYFAVLAFDLMANGIDLGEQKLDADLAASLTIPRE